MRKELVISLLVAIAGCAHPQTAKKDATPEQRAAEAKAASQQAPATASGPSVPAGTRCSNDLDCGNAQLCIRQACVAITPDLAECNQVKPEFAFDSADLRESAKHDLARSARCLKADHALHVTVVGNADERGTDEYNMALGDQRATAVAHYLRALGASDNQLRTVSYGKERPLCVEHDEACWAINRRAELQLAKH